MSIHLVVGRQGSGKTLFLVKTALEYINANKKVYSNVHLNFKYSPLVYKDILDCKLTNCCTILDEVHLLLPARLSLRKINQEICDNFLSMARKQRNDIYGSTQTLRKVDIRFREEADYIYYCTKYAYINEQWTEILHDAMLSGNTQAQLMISVEVEEVFSGEVIRIAFMGNKYFTWYDTMQIVKVEGLDEAMQTKRGRK